MGGPAFLDALQSLFADAVNGEQPIGFLVQNADGIRAERVHDAPGEAFAHALDEPGGQIQADTFAGDRQHFLQMGKFQLAAEAGIVDPAACHADVGSRLRADGMSHAGDGIAADGTRRRARDL